MHEFYDFSLDLALEGAETSSSTALTVRFALFYPPSKITQPGPLISDDLPSRAAKNHKSTK